MDLIAVAEFAVDLAGRIMKLQPVRIEEVGFAAGLDVLDVGVHDHVLCAGFLEDLGATGAVVIVGMADEQDFDLTPFEAELFYAGADLGRRGGQIAVDENEAHIRGDEVAGQVAAADVIEISGDAEGRQLGGPVRVEIEGQAAGAGGERGGCRPEQS